MKSIICLISSNYNGISFIYVILAYISSVLSTPPCGLYGAPPCQFVPAPPGQTPACARPGKTYCEHVDNYPTYLIKHLVHKWGYEAKNLLIDETWDDFAAVAWHETPVFYDPAYIFPTRHYNGVSGGGGGVGASGGKRGGHDFGGYNYATPGGSSVSASGGGSGSGDNIGAGSKSSDAFLITKHQTTEPPTYLLYSSAGQRLNLSKNRQVSPNNPTIWLKRIVRDLSREEPAAGYSYPHSPNAPNNATATETATAPATAKVAATETATITKSRDVSLNMDLLELVGVEKDDRARTKRQSPGRSSLCQTTSQFITPQAALNSKGNWMFVVNEANTARQMVKAELCASNTCSNLCQLPNGYNSRCEQKFVQKRLIALQANGQNLYTDTFWFPSCCVCTISAN